MKRKFGNMWDTYATESIFCITGNSFLKRDGSLVMGRGIARQARDRIPGIDKYFGQRIASSCEHLGEYGLTGRVRDAAFQSILLFQVKKHYSENASLFLIEYATSLLKRHAEMFLNTGRVFNLNYPGIGNGRLDQSTVYEIIKVLPDNVHVWQWDSSRTSEYQAIYSTYSVFMEDHCAK